MHDVLIFEEVTQQNIHLCQQKVGLYTGERELMIGQFDLKNSLIHLVSNDFKKHRFDFKQTKHFWKLFAVYQHK